MGNPQPGGPSGITEPDGPSGMAQILGGGEESAVVEHGARVRRAGGDLLAGDVTWCGMEARIGRRDGEDDSKRQIANIKGGTGHEVELAGRVVAKAACLPECSAFALHSLVTLTGYPAAGLYFTFG